MESVAAVDLLLAGADLVVLRHPETVKRIKKFIETMT
jgi:acetyl-CoA decarbonylase/synthase complex subunit delta